MTPKFKVGDLVVLVNNYQLAAKLGATATVVKVTKYIYVKWIRNELSNQQNDGGYGLNDFKLAEITNWREKLQ